MAVLPLVDSASPILRRRALPVTETLELARKLGGDMLDTMYAKGGIGLAANQVGFLLRVIVVDLSDRQNTPMIMINPVITKARGKQTVTEGCLSYPGRKVRVTRAAKITVKYLDEHGDPRSLKASNMFAQCVQHEVDHLDGICAVGGKAREVTRLLHVPNPSELEQLRERLD